jgi:hypothetical protein
MRARTGLLGLLWALPLAAASVEAQALPDPEGLVTVLMQSLVPSGPRTSLTQSSWYGDASERNGVPREAALHATTWYVSLAADDGRMTDPPPDALAAVHIAGARMAPGSAASAEAFPGAPRQGEVRYRIQAPHRRPDGHYDVVVNYVSGASDSGWLVVEMAYDAPGWRAVSHAAYSVK